MLMKFCARFPREVRPVSAEEKVGQQAEKQIYAGCCQLCHALHAEVHSQGVDDTDYGQDGDGQEVCLRYAENTA